jgi:hypothetical protein
MAYGYSAMVFDQRVFVTYNPFNLYVTQVGDAGDARVTHGRLPVARAPVAEDTSHAPVAPGPAAARSRPPSPPSLPLFRIPPPPHPSPCLPFPQPEVKPGCVLRRSNFSVLEREKLVDNKQVRGVTRV